MNRPVVIGLVAMVAIVVVGSIALPKGIDWAISGIMTRQTSAIAFANGASAAITKAWDVEALSSLATPDYYDSVKKDGTAAWASYRLLGAPQSSTPCTSDGLNINNGVAVAQLQCASDFKNGKASLQLDITDAGGAWKITSLHVVL